MSACCRTAPAGELNTVIGLPRELNTVAEPRVVLDVLCVSGEQHDTVMVSAVQYTHHPACHRAAAS